MSASPAFLEMVRRAADAHVAAGTLVRLSCPACGTPSILRHDNPNRGNWHCFCKGVATPTRMTEVR